MSTKTGDSAEIILNRAREAFDITSDSKLSILLGGGRTNISAWRKRNVVPYEGLYWSCRSNGINFDWVITGEGNQKRSYQGTAEAPAIYAANSEFVQIPFYKVDISAGHGNHTNEESFKPFIFRREFFDELGLTASDLVGANVPGDSMQPLIPASSGILIDKTDHKMTDGKVYVFNADGHLLVKKIVVDFEGYIARSINPEYADIPLTKNKVDSLIIVGRARLALPYIKL